VGIAAYTAIEVISEILIDEDMVEVVMEDPDLGEAPPPPPPPPPPPAAADVEEEEEEEEEVEDNPDEMDEEVNELDEKVKEEVKSQKVVGAEGGVEGGEEGGVVGGVIGGVEGGVIGGQLGGVRAFHHSELEVKRRRTPDYPEAARSLNLGKQRCKVRVLIDEKGIPYQATVEDCPKVFHESARQAIMQWRWYPPRAGRDKVKAQTVIVINYNLQ
jgi:hypothetical protein